MFVEKQIRLSFIVTSWDIAPAKKQWYKTWNKCFSCVDASKCFFSSFNKKSIVQCELWQNILRRLYIYSRKSTYFPTLNTRLLRLQNLFEEKKTQDIYNGQQFSIDRKKSVKGLMCLIYHSSDSLWCLPIFWYKKKLQCIVVNVQLVLDKFYIYYLDALKTFGYFHSFAEEK